MAKRATKRKRVTRRKVYTRRTVKRGGGNGISAAPPPDKAMSAPPPDKVMSAPPPDKVISDEEMEANIRRESNRALLIEKQHEIQDIDFYYQYAINLNSLSFPKEIQDMVTKAIKPLYDYDGNGPIPVSLLNSLQENVETYEKTTKTEYWRIIAKVYWAARKNSGLDK